MGCDIHVYREKLNNKGDWESTEEWLPSEDSDEERELVCNTTTSYISRDYLLFGILTNGQVRYEIGANYLVYCRGIPENCDPRITAQHTEWGCDAHSASYLTIGELQSMLSELKKHVVLGLTPCVPRGITALKEFIEEFPQDDVDHHRIVFWFDN